MSSLLLAVGVEVHAMIYGAREFWQLVSEGSYTGEEEALLRKVALSGPLGYVLTREEINPARGLVLRGDIEEIGQWRYGIRRKDKAR